MQLKILDQFKESLRIRAKLIQKSEIIRIHIADGFGTDGLVDGINHPCGQWFRLEQVGLFDKRISFGDAFGGGFFGEDWNPVLIPPLFAVFLLL